MFCGPEPSVCRSCLILGPMLPSYNPAILGSFAQRLLRQANTIVVVYVLLGLVAAAVAYYNLHMLWPLTPGMRLLAPIATVIVATYAGFERSFALRVQAQTVLCQVSIEANTRQLSITTQLGHVQTPR